MLFVHFPYLSFHNTQKGEYLIFLITVLANMWMPLHLMLVNNACSLMFLKTSADRYAYCLSTFPVTCISPVYRKNNLLSWYQMSWHIYFPSCIYTSLLLWWSGERTPIEDVYLKVISFKTRCLMSIVFYNECMENQRTFIMEAGTSFCLQKRIGDFIMST